MPFRVLMHNGDTEEDYRLVKTERELREAIHQMVEAKEDDWHSGDTITIAKITDVDASNEKFWVDLTAEMQKRK